MEFPTLWQNFPASTPKHWLKLCLLSSPIWHGNVFAKWVRVLQYMNLGDLSAASELAEPELKLYAEHCKNKRGFFRMLCLFNRLETMKWFVDKFILIKEDLKHIRLDCYYVALNDNSSLLQLIIDKFNLTKEDLNATWGSSPFRGAIKYDRLDTLKWLIHRFELTKEDSLLLLHEAAFQGSLRALMLIAEETNITKADISPNFGSHICKEAYSRGHKNIVSWLINKYNIKWSRPTFNDPGTIM